MLVATGTPAPGNASAFDVRPFGRLAVILKSPAGEQLSLTDGMSRISLRLIVGSFFDGPIDLQFVIADSRAASQLRALAQFRSLRQRGHFGAWSQRPEIRAPRLISQLRAYDALNARASERDIAATLFGHQRTKQDWPDRDGSLRSAVRRLVATARRNVAGGYRDLLSGG